MIDGKIFFIQPIKDNKVTYENIRKNNTVQGDDYTTDCLLHYPYFKNKYKKIVEDLGKQQILDENPRENQKIIFTTNLDKLEDIRIYFTLEEAKETKLNFLRRTVKVLYICYRIIFSLI